MTGNTNWYYNMASSSSLGGNTDLSSLMLQSMTISMSASAVGYTFNREPSAVQVGIFEKKPPKWDFWSGAYVRS